MATTEICVHALAEVNKDAAEVMDRLVSEPRKPRHAQQSS